MVLFFLIGIADFAGAAASFAGFGEGDGSHLTVAEIQALALVRTMITLRITAVADIDLVGIRRQDKKHRQYDNQFAHGLTSTGQLRSKQRSRRIAGS